MRRVRVIATIVATIVATLLSPYISLGQNSIIEFEESSHYFGNIRESGGVVSCLFVCKNVGENPLLIDEVRTGCDCTTAEWREEAIAPGESDTITVHFNPRGLPGKFIKSIAVFANTSPSATTLTIRGYVIPREEGEEDALPEEASGVELNDGSSESVDESGNDSVVNGDVNAKGTTNVNGIRNRNRSADGVSEDDSGSVSGSGRGHDKSRESGITNESGGESANVESSTNSKREGKRLRERRAKN